jgi:2'-5' RNA ligase
MTEESVRAFIALDLDGPTRVRLSDEVARLERMAHGIRWVREEGAHLTLRFLGQTPPAALESLRARLSPAAAACPAADVAVRGLGFFPERGRVRVLWVDMKLTPAMMALQAEVERATVDAGLPKETRAFRPHLTLGRWREAVPRPVLPDVDLGATRVDRLVLYRSQLNPKGAVYTPIHVFPLGPAAP